MKTDITRKRFLSGAGAMALAGPLAFAARPAKAAKRYVIKFGIDLPLNDPLTDHAIAASKEIAAATKGAVEVQVFPNNELGNDTHMLSEVRSGAIQMMSIGDNILATLVPSAGIDNLGFAFQKATTAWAALDGAVGDIVRSDIEKIGLQPMHAIWDLGFREITSSTRRIETVGDLHGFKIRVPPSPISLSLFRDLGASPVTMNFAELYTALQTRTVDGQETPLATIEASKYFEVQKYCALTNHMWVGNWILMNGDYWKSLPANYRDIIADTFNAQAAKERVANDALGSSLQKELTSQGLIFSEPDTAPFRALLAESGFYKRWHEKFGTKLWSTLEKYSGTLA